MITARGSPPPTAPAPAQPFVRFGAGHSAEGSGLGLSLVAAIVRLHRGRLVLEDNEPGLRVLIDLPA